jgi:hypothetical protein
VAARLGQTVPVTVAAIAQAAQAEGLEPAVLGRLAAEIDPADLAGLVNHAREMQAPATLADWRSAWPTVLGPLPDAEASALVRLAVALAGGEIVEPGGQVTRITLPVVPGAPMLGMSVRGPESDR